MLILSREQIEKEAPYCLITRYQQKILESARQHPVMGVRLACISDLEATKSKYHISCYTKFFRETLHNKDTVKEPDTTMALVCKELENSARCFETQ